MVRKLTNTLRVDPTRTTMLRAAFMRDMSARFRRLRTAITKLVGDEDAFGLGRSSVKVPSSGAVVSTVPLDAVVGDFTANVVVTNKRWAFVTDDKKLDSYRKWLKAQVDADILSVDRVNEATPWTQTYIDSAYRRGVVRAYTDTHKMVDASFDFIEGGKAAFLEMAFASPVAQSKLRLLGTRAFAQLQGVTAEMDKEMSRILAQGLAQGTGPRALARVLSGSVSGLERKRALTIARTEVIHAHAEGQLDAFEAMNIEDVGVMAEWSTATDDAVCDMCAPLEGVVLTIREARGMLPRHPNCRCAWIPANVGEHKGGTTKTTWAGKGQGLSPPGTAPTGQTTGQVWTKRRIEEGLRKSIKAEHPKLGVRAARDASRWRGADLKVTGKARQRKKVGA